MRDTGDLERDAKRALDAADAAMDVVRHHISAAALACLRGASDAAALVRRALDRVDEARLALHRAQEDLHARGVLGFEAIDRERRRRRK